jgi:hypothetical protein
MSNYRIQLRQAEDGTYVATCPGLAGFSTAKGRTRWEAVENMRVLIYGSTRGTSALNVPWRVEDTNIKIK